MKAHKILLLFSSCFASVRACHYRDFSLPFYRAYLGGDGTDHFYTADKGEYQAAISNGYSGEGIVGRIFDQPYGAEPFYRLYHSTAGAHFYTTSEQERRDAIKAGYKEEGIAGYVYTNAECASEFGGSAPLYRLNSTRAVDHFYTMSAQERDSAVQYGGYVYEKIACWIYPNFEWLSQ